MVENRNVHNPAKNQTPCRTALGRSLIVAENIVSQAGTATPPRDVKISPGAAGIYVDNKDAEFILILNVTLNYKHTVLTQEVLHRY
jgi:hypothetical protein